MKGKADMWRWARRIVAALFGVLILAAVSGATWQWLATRRELVETPPPGRLIDVGGHRLHLWCTGAGAPAVILENGLGGSTAGWGFVQPDVARFTQVCSYRPRWHGLQRSRPVTPDSTAHRE